MEAVQELLPLAREMLAARPRSKLVKLYVLGGVLALVGAVIGLVETVCSPFAAAGRLRDQEAAAAELRAARERRALPEKGKQPAAALCGRALSNRLHAS
ncbi:G0/G1 switch protein 2 [Oryctolagus cuniculus]|uniref:G0/G1 switch 2 n=1 Tax=Oryctolagus cuniculus TaxID=9986 RepID=G1SKX3_RABIT|nr:G0/G1 switch protein 2 [Oryctolagus cuniculus]